MSTVSNDFRNTLIGMKLDDLTAILNRLNCKDVLLVVIADDTLVVNGYGSDAGKVLHMLDKVREDIEKRAGKHPETRQE